MNGNRRARPVTLPNWIISRCCALFRWRVKFVLFFLFCLSLISILCLIVPNHVFEKNKREIEDHDIIMGTPLEIQPVETTNSLLEPLLNITSNLRIDQQIPVLVFSAKRPKAIENHLKQLISLRPSANIFPIIVSQDGDDQYVTKIIQKFASENPQLYQIRHNERKPVPAKKTVANYYYISQHYKWALEQIFIRNGFKLAIITEEDLDISNDFFAYFNATYQLLYSDSTIWCISAWNDNGNPSFVDWEGGGTKLWRTDFFPGLGWMLRAELWHELRQNWPEAFWDDWLRQPNIRQERVCIRPEISRTLHNLAVAGKGSSNGLYKSFLSSMRLPEKPAEFMDANVTNLLKKENYDQRMDAELRLAKEISMAEMLEKPPTRNETTQWTGAAVNNEGGSSTNLSYIVWYSDPREFRQLAKKFGLMVDIRSGMARTSYYGVVPFFVSGIQFYAVHRGLQLDLPFGSMASTQVYNQTWDKMSKYLDFADIYCKPNRYNGKCDPYDEPMIQWFRTKGWTKRLEQWGEMTVF